jgi:hypothetical protein
MRNLKRSIALMIALIMCMGFISLPSLAAHDPENGECTHTPEVPCDCTENAGEPCDKCVEGEHDECEADEGCSFAEATGTCICDDGSGDGGSGGTGEWDGFVPVTDKKFQSNAMTLNTAKTALVAPTAPTALPTLSLFTERLVVPNGFTIAGYDLGKGWKAGAPTDKMILGLINKGGTLKLTDKMSPKAKDGPEKGTAAVVGVAASGATDEIPGTPGEECDCEDDEGDPCDACDEGDHDNCTEGGCAFVEEIPTVPASTGSAAVEEVAGVVPGYVITFAKIEARKKDVKLSVNYTFFEDRNFESNGAWTLAAKNATAFKLSDVADLQIAKPADGKKMGAEDVYVDEITASMTSLKDIGDLLEGIGVLDSVEGKAVKTTYFIRTAPNNNSGKFNPATRGYKVSAVSAGKAPNAKPNYKASIIKPKGGQAISLTESGNTWTLYGKAANAGRTIVALPAKGADPELPASTLSSQGWVRVVTYATAKKPASEILYIKIATQAAALTGDGGMAIDAKAKWSFPKELQATANPVTATSKWGKAPKLTVPAANKTDTFTVRTRGTAKAAKPAAANGRLEMGFEGASAGPNQVATVAWTVVKVDDETTVTAVVSVAAP